MNFLEKLGFGKKPVVANEAPVQPPVSTETTPAQGPDTPAITTTEVVATAETTVPVADIAPGLGGVAVGVAPEATPDATTFTPVDTAAVESPVTDNFAIPSASAPVAESEAAPDVDTTTETPVDVTTTAPEVPDVTAMSSEDIHAALGGTPTVESSVAEVTVGAAPEQNQ